MRATEDLLRPAREVAGDAAVRAGDSADAVLGAVPTLVVVPPDRDALAATLAWAHRDRLAVVVRGGATKIGWAGRPARLDLVLSTTGLRPTIDHRHGDLTVTVGAGVTMDRLNQELARHGQWLALDPPWTDRATVGGVLATNDAGPRRYRHGAPRDLLIGVELARADGRLARAGGHVVKNVAGYDLGKLLAGSHGCLAVILSASFKLTPVAPASATVTTAALDATQFGGLLRAIRASQAGITAVESRWPPFRLLTRIETAHGALAPQVEQVARVYRDFGGRPVVVDGGEETALWREHAEAPWAGRGAVVKVSTLPAELRDTLVWLERETAAGGLEAEAAGRAGLGLQVLRIDGAPEAQARLVTALRHRLPRGRGSAVVLRGTADLPEPPDRWGPRDGAGGVMRAVKQRLDPFDILAPGRGPGAH